MPSDPMQHLPAVFRWSQALSAGMTPAQIRRLVARGCLTRVARGIYRSHDPDALAADETWQLVRAAHLQRCMEALARHRGHVVSHQSAAVVHDLGLQLHPDMDVHLTAVHRVPRSSREPGLQRHHADSVENETVRVDGIPVTTIPRTVADVLRTSRPPHSVPVLDAAVRGGVLTARQVEDVLDGQKRWRGRPRALAAFALRDPRRETWLESYSFVTLHEHGIPLPLAQVEVFDQGFHLIGRVDGLCVQTGTFLEADGAGKYLALAEDGRLSPEESVARASSAQEVRHARLLALGLTGARWSTREIRHDTDAVVRRVRAAMAAGDPGGFRGWLRYDAGYVRIGQLGRQMVAASTERASG